MESHIGCRSKLERPLWACVGGPVRKTNGDLAVSLDFYMCTL